ncbi:hypothetical protein HID58_022035 [Brassica napus]|uniref:Uncharacterized protein n=1 Tax=Brassica napus TaxID=3708 RepID=A0ABQ8CY37_BRANA|nr:hypothetical protein HID58_022035 [Brassica napus]
MAMVMTQRIQSGFETNPNASRMLSKAEEKNSRRTNRGAAVCPEGDPERRTGEAGLTKSRSGHQQPMESTPDAARTPEDDKSTSRKSSTEQEKRALEAQR